MSDQLEPKRTSRDLNEIQELLEQWIKERIGDSEATISDLRRPSGSGMSSETLLFNTKAKNTNHNTEYSLVARLAPTPADIPVFQKYDLDLQVRIMKIVQERTSIPVPNVLWLETDPTVLEVPFFVMEQVDGRVPPDIPPYVFGGWILETSLENQKILEHQSVGIISQLSKIDLEDIDTNFLEFEDEGNSHLRRHFSAQRNYYHWVIGDKRKHPVIEHAFTWLEQNWPEESATVLSWGDARIGNIMFNNDSFVPAAVLDWEMAGLAPVEVDLGWLVFLHSFFQDIAQTYEFPGLPDFMMPETVREIFRDQTGHLPQDLHWFMVYAGLRHAIIMSRINDRSVHFGQAAWTKDVDEVIPHRNLLWALME